MKNIIFATLLVGFSAQAKPWMALDLNTWNTLKNMCENYKDFGAQVPPEDIQVKCQTTRKFTSVVSSKDVVFPSSGSLIMSISSSKANVNPASAALTLSPVTVQCPVVAQFKQVASGTFPATCAELQAAKGSFSEFCLEKLSSGNYEGAAEQIPGTEKSLCATTTKCDEQALN